MDLLCADNFARAAAAAGVEQIVYLGGLVPDTKHLSPHLESRLEVEETLARHGVPVTTLRAGLVIGPGGSSFEILRKLVGRLPAMICPQWTQNRTQPVDLDDVVGLLSFSLGHRACFGETFDVGAPEAMTYRELMALCAELMGVQRRMVPVRFVSPGLSRLWVSLVTGASSALVGPLVESLRHEMVARDHRLADMAGMRPTPVRESLVRALSQTQAARGPAPRVSTSTSSQVRSVQRMQLPAGRDARWATLEYAKWLERSFFGLVRVVLDDHGGIAFHFLTEPKPLLSLVWDEEHSTSDRQLFSLGRGLLSREDDEGRFELRQVLDGETLLIAVHDYSPSLPWGIYVLTQAPAHAWVMAAFRRHLRRVGRRASTTIRDQQTAP